MEPIKKFNEYTKSMYENKSAFDKEKIVYKTYFPKDNEDGYIYIRDKQKCCGTFSTVDTNMQISKNSVVV